MDCTCRFCFSIQNRKDRLHQRLRRWKYYKEQKIRLFKISIYLASYFWLSFPGGLESNAGDLGWIAGLGISPGERNGKPTPAFLLGESHGQRNLAASPWGRKESDTTERLTHTHFWLFWASVAVWAFSSSWECGLLCIVAVNRLFIGVASLVPGHRRQSAGSVVVMQGPTRCAAFEILLNQESSWCPLHCKADSQPLDHQGNLRTEVRLFPMPHINLYEIG